MTLLWVKLPATAPRSAFGFWAELATSECEFLSAKRASNIEEQQQEDCAAERSTSWCERPVAGSLPTSRHWMPQRSKVLVPASQTLESTRMPSHIGNQANLGRPVAAS
ncbi:hypothetical protein TMatcc_009242 [Talaromyces marneffei ATCC 18224]